MKHSIGSEKINKLTIEADGKVFHAPYQFWYPSLRQRMSGCGPVVASNIAAVLADLPYETKDDCLWLMTTMWDFVTPGIYGLHHEDMFADGLNAFFDANGLPFACRKLHCPKKNRLPFADVAAFVSNALDGGCPVAMLNLNPFADKELEPWHWVTLVDLDDETNVVEVFDQEKHFFLDLKVWYENTRKRCGFVYACAK